MLVITLSGAQISRWPGVQVWRLDNQDQYHNVTRRWNFSDTPHHHYEVVRLNTGSFYCPVSTNPPAFWQLPVPVIGTAPAVPGSVVNPNGNEFRPTGTYFWIPAGSIPRGTVPGSTVNDVICNCPHVYPPALQLQAGQVSDEAALLRTRDAASHARASAFDTLAEILPSTHLLRVAGDSDQKAFSDSDGLVSFVNLSSSFVTGNKAFLTGRNVCDKVSSFFATLRQNVYAAQLRDAKYILEGDSKPKDQWDLPVTHKMQKMLIDAGGLSSFKITTETVSTTQVLAEFSSDFVKLIFDVALVPASIIEGVVGFIQGVGETLRTSWDDRSRSFTTTLLGQCHEAVPVDSTGQATVYIPKIKYFHIAVTSEQTAFTTPCSKISKITFNFQFENYVTALKASVLDEASDDYKSFVAYLDKAQRVNYRDAENNLDAILSGSTSTGASSVTTPHLLEEMSELGIAASEYPQVIQKTPRLAASKLKLPSAQLA